MKTLRECLSDYDATLLRAIGERTGVELSTNHPPSMVEEIAGEAVVEEAPENGRIARVKSFEVQSMDAEEAVEQMELLGHDFYVFLNAQTGTINVVYRRLDEDYGLLQPEVG